MVIRLGQAYSRGQRIPFFNRLRPYEHLWNAFHLRPFAGLNLSGVYLDPPAIAIDGVGAFAFARTGDAATS